ncbi:MAG: PQQ-dependent sugar dehydrogenase [Deltaproteobacteria bacterium]|nr:PQQ-dependent sugar dehydrogenase [Deltaproteobacteria bacterium]
MIRAAQLGYLRFILGASLIVTGVFALASPLTAGAPVVMVDDVGGDLTGAIALANAGDQRMFVIQQTGEIRIWDGSSTLSTPFLDLGGLLIPGGEQGLLGLAFHPDYGQNGFFYVNYTDTEGDTVVARYSVSAGDPNVADSASAQAILAFDQTFTNHNGGDLHFGPDGYLYISSGDGGGPASNSQTLSNLLGKLLRIDVDNDDFPADPDRNYAIPGDNPFVGVPSAMEEIWSLGLRNPWRISFDRQTGDLFIGDVGEGAWEEISFQPSTSTGGENYGWPCYEGPDPFDTTGCDPPGSYVFPIDSLPHDVPPNNNCSVIAGRSYRGQAYPALRGWFFYTDWCTGILWGARPDGTGGWETHNLLTLSGFTYTGFGEDNQGEIFIAAGESIARLSTTEDPLFEDGFESGDVSAWTASFP